MSVLANQPRELNGKNHDDNSADSDADDYDALIVPDEMNAESSVEQRLRFV